MANSQKGERSVELNGKIYTLALTFTSMATLEGQFGKTFTEISQLAGGGSMTHVRAMLWALLQRHHPEITIEDAGNLFTLSDLDDLTALMGMSARASAPDPRDLPSGASSKKNPTRARAKSTGTGASSF